MEERCRNDADRGPSTDTIGGAFPGRPPAVRGPGSVRSKSTTFAGLGPDFAMHGLSAHRGTPSCLQSPPERTRRRASLPGGGRFAIWDPWFIAGRPLWPWCCVLSTRQRRRTGAGGWSGRPRRRSGRRRRDGPSPDARSVQGLRHPGAELLPADLRAAVRSGPGRQDPDAAPRAMGRRRRLTWEFRLRPGMRFHDGGELTAADVVYSLRGSWIHRSTRLDATSSASSTPSWRSTR